MGRKKAVHPADAYRRAQRKKAIKKNKLQRQASRASALRQKTEEEIVHEIQKINTHEHKGTADTRLLIRRKQLLGAFNEVQKKRKELEKRAHTAKTTTMKGFGKLMKIFGGDETKPGDADKENQAELEFPPGIPRNPKFERPPGIVPRPQNARRTRTFLKRKDDNIQKPQTPARRNFGNVEIVNQHRSAQLNMRQLRRKGGRASELFDPMNPASPFYLDRPGQRKPLPPGGMPGQFQPPPPSAPRPVPAQIGPQRPGPGNTASGPQPAIDNARAARMGIAPVPARPMAGIGPPGGMAVGYSGMGPGMAAPISYPGAQKQKLEVLLSEDMKSLIPTNLRVKRKQPLSRRSRKKGLLDIAPDVGGAKSAKKTVKKKGGMAVNDAYDDFLTDLGDLA